MKRMETAEMSFLRVVTGYRRKTLSKTKFRKEEAVMEFDKRMKE
jgi:hypothetical protein